jgi:hypothetical protein
VEWLFTGLLIAASVGIAGFTGYLLRRLFTTEPGRPDVPAPTSPAGFTGPPTPEEATP